MNRFAIVAMALLAVGESRADPSSPYYVAYGRLDAIERADLDTRNADEARARGDEIAATRYATLACWHFAAASFDPDLHGAACDRAKAAMATHDLPDTRAQLLLAEGSLAAWRLDIARAVDRLGAAVAAGAKLDLHAPDAAPVRRAHFALGAILLEGGRYDLALAELKLANDASRAAGQLEMVAWSDLWLCRAHTLLGDRERAAARCAAVDAYLQRDPDVFVELSLRWMQAEMDYGAGRYDDALRHYQRAAELSAMRGGELLRGNMRINVATTLIALGRVDDAKPILDELSAAVAAGTLPDTYAPGIAEQQAEIAIAKRDPIVAAQQLELAASSRQHWVSIRALGRLARVRNDSGDIAGTRAAHEEAIRRIESERTAVDGTLQRALFMAIHAAPYRELAAMTASPERAIEIAEAGRARALLDALRATEVAGSAANPPTAAEIRAHLAAGEVLVDYVSAEQRLFALVATSQTIVAVPLPRAGAAKDLAARVGFFRKLVSEANDNADLDPTAGSLFADLVAPVLAAAPEATTIIVSPDGPLDDLPFEALPPRREADRLAFARVPSAAVLVVPARGGASVEATLVTAPSDAADLPGAIDEARELVGQLDGDVTLLAGGDATIPHLTAMSLDRFAVLHFAGHAVLDPLLPLRSALILAPSDHDDGYWRAADIYRRSLDADLVVLSACSTARGAAAGGEGVSSLARAFMFAGARATISSLWDVDDRGSASFSAALYPRLAAGESVGSAVAGARRELREHHASPKVWAAYVLTGAPARHVRATARRAEAKESRWLWFGLLGVGAAALAAFVWLRRR